MREFKTLEHEDEEEEEEEDGSTLSADYSDGYVKEAIIRRTDLKRRRDISLTPFRMEGCLMPLSRLLKGLVARWKKRRWKP